MTDSTHKSVSIKNVKIDLLPERGIFFPAEKLLAVADTHFGKGASLRKEGILVPRGHTEDDFVRLAKLILKTKAERLVFMGDLIHSRFSKTELLSDMARTWKSVFTELDIVLLMGNHDRASGKIPESFGINHITEYLDINHIRLQHEPETVKDRYVIAGHIHPGVSLQDKIAGRIKMPCFYFTKEYGIVPAFGSFTGLAIMKKEKDVNCYAIADNNVVKI